MHDKHLANAGGCSAVLARCMPGGEMEAIVLRQDKKPNLDKESNRQTSTRGAVFGGWGSQPGPGSS
ncbi:TPA: hypothetical protein ACH3X1_011465 [Trebouxia sp. C0004]